MPMRLDNLRDQKILIIGNSPESKNYEFQKLIDENFFTLRFKCNNLPYKSNKLCKYLGKHTDSYFKTRSDYIIDGTEIKCNTIRKNFVKKYKSKPTRGIECILLFLKYFKEKNYVDKKLYIHGFSFDSNNITPKWKNEARKFQRQKWRKIRRKRLKALGTYHIDKLSHNYTVEKEIVNSLISDGHIVLLTDYHKSIN